MILSRGKWLDAPLAELRDFESTWREPEPAHGDLGRIVKEVMDCLHPDKLLVEEYAKKKREAIVAALMESKGRVGGPDGAAARLGLNRTTLIARMKRFGIDRRPFTQTECGFVDSY